MPRESSLTTVFQTVIFLSALAIGCTDGREDTLLADIMSPFNSHLSVADVNGDGREDLVAVVPGLANLEVFLGTPSGLNLHSPWVDSLPSVETCTRTRTIAGAMRSQGQSVLVLDSCRWSVVFNDADGMKRVGVQPPPEVTGVDGWPSAFVTYSAATDSVFALMGSQIHELSWESNGFAHVASSTLTESLRLPYMVEPVLFSDSRSVYTQLRQKEPDELAVFIQKSTDREPTQSALSKLTSDPENSHRPILYDRIAEHPVCPGTFLALSAESNPGTRTLQHVAFSGPTFRTTTAIDAVELRTFSVGHVDKGKGLLLLVRNSGETEMWESSSCTEWTKVASGWADLDIRPIDMIVDGRRAGRASVKSTVTVVPLRDGSGTYFAHYDGFDFRTFRLDRTKGTVIYEKQSVHHERTDNR